MHVPPWSLHAWAAPRNSCDDTHWFCWALGSDTLHLHYLAEPVCPGLLWGMPVRVPSEYCWQPGVSCTLEFPQGALGSCLGGTCQDSWTVPEDQGTFQSCWWGLGQWTRAGNKVGLLGLLWGTWAWAGLWGRPRTSSRLVCVPGSCSLPQQHVEGVQTVAHQLPQARLPPVVSLPSGGCLVLKLGFFHLWSSCTLSHQALS